MSDTIDGDDHPYPTVRRRLGDHRKKILEILHNADEPLPIGEVFGQEGAGVPYGSREHHLGWLTRRDADNGDDLWWPDELGQLVEIVNRGGPREGRILAITEDGERVIATLRAAGVIDHSPPTARSATDEEFETLQIAHRSLSESVGDLKTQIDETAAHVERIQAQLDALEAEAVHKGALKSDITMLEQHLYNLYEASEADPTTIASAHE